MFGREGIVLIIPEFNTVNVNQMNFRQIFEIYDNQFNSLREILLKLGDKFIAQTFTGSTNQLLTLENTFDVGKGQVFVFFNGVVQWVNENYEEETNQSIRLLFDRQETDEIKVVIVKSHFLNGGSVLDSVLLTKADKEDTYTKGEVDGLVSGVQGGLAEKADALDTYTKDEVDTFIVGKADKINSYTKTELDGLFLQNRIKIATETEIGGVKAKSRVGETVEVVIDSVTGKLYVPEAVFMGNVLPTPSAEYRGRLFTVMGDVGEADLVYICIKDSSDNYAWRQI